MGKRFLWLVVLAIAPLSSSEPAEAGTHFVSGDACQEAYGAERGDISRSSYGTQNNNSGALRWIWCPIMGISNPSSMDIIDAEIFYYDGSASTQVKCELWARTETGTGYVTGFKYSQPNHSPPWTTTQGANLGDTGYGFLYWLNPLNGGNAISNVATVSFKCGINYGDKLLGFYVYD